MEDKMVLTREIVADQVLDPFSKAKDLEELNQCFLSLCFSFKMNEFFLGEVTGEKTEDLILYCYTTYPKDWMSIYLEREYHKVDPILLNIEKLALPYSWNVDSFMTMDGDQRNFYREAYDYGIRSGTTIPLEIEDKRRRYLTVLNPTMHQNWSLVMLFMIAGIQYFVHKDHYDKMESMCENRNVRRTRKTRELKNQEAIFCTIDRT